MKPRTGPVSESAKHQLKFLTQELKRPGESITELYVRALKKIKDSESALDGWRKAIRQYK
jgi:hypothetical protein